MTDTEAIDAINRAASYLTWLSIEPGAESPTEGRLADGLRAAMKHFAVERIPIENGKTATVQATIPHGAIPVRERCEVCDWPLFLPKGHPADDCYGCTPGNCCYRPPHGTPEHTRIANRRKELAARQGQRIVDDLAARTVIKPLVWTDNATESETVPANYQVDQGPNGWHAYYFSDPADATPDQESDGLYYTRLAAKEWCDRHHAGEELEPPRCERCRMPIDVATNKTHCSACQLVNPMHDEPVVGELVNGQAVHPLDIEIPF